MLELDLATAQVNLPWWIVGALGVLIVALLMVAMLRSGVMRAVSALARISVIIVAIGGGWLLLDHLKMRDRGDERRQLENRFAELTNRALLPGTGLACLDVQVSETVLDACEKTIFASAQDVAAAVAYTSARLTLLRDATEFASRVADYEPDLLLDLRQSAERDRYGFVAYILETRNRCTPERCDAFALWDDNSRVLTNIRNGTFQRHIARYSEGWGAQGPAPAANAGGTPELASTPGAVAPRPSSIEFPSAASIPAVSIMNNEPGANGQNGMEAKPEQKPGARSDAKPAKPASAPRTAASKPETRGASKPAEALSLAPPQPDQPQQPQQAQ